MENEILRNFYQRTLPLYRPQAEKFLQTAQPKDFNEVSFRYTFSVKALIHISNIIEDFVLANKDVADVHVSFQKMSRLADQRERYLRLAKSAKGLWLYGEADASETELSQEPRVTMIDTGDTLLERYWFVVAYGPGVGMSLLAEEVSALTGEDRYYEGFYTFEADVAYQIIAILHQLYPQSVPRPLLPDLLSEY